MQNNDQIDWELQAEFLAEAERQENQGQCVAIMNHFRRAMQGDRRTVEVRAAVDRMLALPFMPRELGGLMHASHMREYIAKILAGDVHQAWRFPRVDVFTQMIRRYAARADTRCNQWMPELEGNSSNIVSANQVVRVLSCLDQCILPQPPGNAPDVAEAKLNVVVLTLGAFFLAAQVRSSEKLLPWGTAASDAYYIRPNLLMQTSVLRSLLRPAARYRSDVQNYYAAYSVGIHSLRSILEAVAKYWEHMQQDIQRELEAHGLEYDLPEGQGIQLELRRALNNPFVLQHTGPVLQRHLEYCLDVIQGLPDAPGASGLMVDCYLDAILSTEHGSLERFIPGQMAFSILRDLKDQTRSHLNRMGVLTPIILSMYVKNYRSITPNRLEGFIAAMSVAVSDLDASQRATLACIIYGRTADNELHMWRHLQETATTYGALAFLGHLHHAQQNPAALIVWILTTPRSFFPSARSFKTQLDNIAVASPVAVSTLQQKMDTSLITQAILKVVLFELRSVKVSPREAHEDGEYLRHLQRVIRLYCAGDYPDADEQFQRLEDLAGPNMRP